MAQPFEKNMTCSHCIVYNFKNSDHLSGFFHHLFVMGTQEDLQWLELEKMTGFTLSKQQAHTILEHGEHQMSKQRLAIFLKFLNLGSLSDMLVKNEKAMSGRVEFTVPNSTWQHEGGPNPMIF